MASFPGIPLGTTAATAVTGQFRFTPRRVTDAEFLFAALLGMAAVMLRQRLEIVYCVWRSDLWLYLPLLAYQDVIALTIIGWVSYGLIALARKPQVRWGIAHVFWYLTLLLGLYTSIDTIVFSYIHTPATYKLFLVSDDLRLVRKSIPEALGGGGPYLWIIVGILLVVTVTEGLS